MPRPKRKDINFTEESLRELYQEAYNDTHNFKAQITAILAKWSPYIKDEGNVAAMGKDIVNLMNALARTNDQKIILLKILKEIVFNKKTASEESTPKNTEQETITQEYKNELMKLVEEARKAAESSN